MTRHERCSWIGLGIGFVVVVGCGRGGLNLAPVEGVVKYKGAPVAKAGVLFTPIEGGPFAMGTTDADGHFTLITANRSGALVGEHNVAISKAETIVKYQRGNPFPIYSTKPLIPQKYFSATTSGLTAKVMDDDNELEFDLTAN